MATVQWLGVAMRQLLPANLCSNSVATLGLDSGHLTMTSIEALAGSLRRAAGFLCPCSDRKLIDAVVEALDGIAEDSAKVREVVENTLEAMIAFGDLIEHRRVGGNETGTGTLIYTAPPAFIRRRSGAAFLIGIIPDRISPLPVNLQNQIEYVNHVRRLTAEIGQDLGSSLRDLGLIELSDEAWLKTPLVESAFQHLERMNRLLDAAPRAGDVLGLSLIDPSTSTNYYRGRWVTPSSHTGRFVARRKQLYGADLWCYVDMKNGSAESLLDLPLRRSRWRGCDAAWQLQAAIDFQNGEPQRFRVRRVESDMRVAEFFSPVPSWAQRRWDAIGDPITATGCLFAYRFSEVEIPEELDFARNRLWLVEAPDSAKS